MSKEHIVLILHAAGAVAFIFLPALVFNGACLLGFCSYTSGHYVSYAQKVQIVWMSLCLAGEYVLYCQSARRTSRSRRRNR